MKKSKQILVRAKYPKVMMCVKVPNGPIGVFCFLNHEDAGEFAKEVARMKWTLLAMWGEE